MNFYPALRDPAKRDKPDSPFETINRINSNIVLLPYSLAPVTWGEK